MSVRRVQKEVNDLSTAPPVNFSVTQDAHDIFHWTGTIIGPQDTPYESGSFSVDIRLPSNYPIHPPSVIFNTKIYHPNVSSKGMLCLSILTNEWRPALTIADVLTTILNLLKSPNTEDPLLPQVANELKTDAERFWQKAREWTQKYAK
jgi:ubiquitin-conjugating enzyme E2 D/E